MSLFFTDSKKPFVSFLLVIIQFLSIFYILFSKLFYPSSWLIIVYFAGIFLGFWAIYEMKKGKLNIMPDVIPGTQIIKNGPYKLVRHPMYLAIFITLLPLVLDYFSIYRLMVYVLLIINQIIKMNYEEQKLAKAFQDYHNYKKTTWRLVPLIY